MHERDLGARGCLWTVFFLAGLGLAFLAGIAIAFGLWLYEALG